MKDAMVYFALDAQGRIVETDESFKACLVLDAVSQFKSKVT